MSISISARTDYSYLFSSLSSNNSTGNSNSSIFNLISDYNTIKSGSYGKLMKAYYTQNNDSVSKVAESKSGISKDTDQTIAKVKSSSSDLYSSTEALLEKGSKSVFNKKEVTTKDENGVETTTQEYDTDAIYKAVSSFVDDYNSMLEYGSDSTNSKILNSLKTMITSTVANEKSLASIGITVEGNDTLSIDEETFKNADMAKVQSIFNGTGSYGYSINTKASFINMYAANDANSASGLYGSSASYLNSYNTGNIYSSYI